MTPTDTGPGDTVPAYLENRIVPATIRHADWRPREYRANESMAGELRAADLKLVEDLFGNGWVMDFTNRTFSDFFRDEVGIDIYNDAYLENGNSKGKRLRTFMQRGQKAAIIKALHGLWEYRTAFLAGADDPVSTSRDRVNALLARLGGQPLAGTASASPSSAPVRSGPSEKLMAELEAEFTAMHGMEDSRQARGYAFERFLKKWFDAWGLDARGSFKLLGEQIDGSFEHRGSVYLIEAKWTTARTDAAALRAFQEKVGDGFEGTRGLFVSYSGFTPEGLGAFNARRVILMDGMDVFDALHQRISLDDVIAAKFRRGTEERRPWIPVRELFS